MATRNDSYISQNRTVKDLLHFCRTLNERQLQAIRYVCSDMWKPYLKVIKEKLLQALHILDRFHIVALLNKGVDEVCRQEARRLWIESYDDSLTKGRYCFLKNPESLTDKQQIKLDDMLQYDLKSVRGSLLKESFQAFWQYRSPYWAEWFLKK